MKDTNTYASFLTSLYGSGMLKYSSCRSDGQMGIFFVRKKDGRLRIIFDTRDINGFFIDPLKTALPSAAALAAVETDGSAPTYFSGGDVRDYFYHLRVPSDMSGYF